MEDLVLMTETLLGPDAGVHNTC